MFWIGFLVGLFVGTTVGVFGLAVSMMNGRLDEAFPVEEKASAAASPEVMGRR